jgi:sugar phosphate isomerase/epimerase
MAAVRGAGVSSWVPDDPWFECLRQELDLAASLGMEFSEIPIFIFDLIAGGRVLSQQVQRLKEAMAGRGLGYTAHGPLGVNFMAPRELLPRHFAVAKASIEVAAEIGAVHLVLHTGITPGEDEAAIEEAYAVQRDAFASLGEIAAAHSIIIAVENIPPQEPGWHTGLPSRVAREVEAIGHPNVRGCLDFSHAAITSTAHGVDFIAEAKALARVSRHLHVHDSFGDPLRIPTYSRSERVAFGLHDLHLPLGWGNLPWQELMTACEFEPDVIFNMELPKPYRPALPDSIRAMREMIGTYRARHPDK